MYKIRIIAFLCTYLKIQSTHVIHPITIQINGFESNENIFRLKIQRFYEILLQNHLLGTKLTILLQDLVSLSRRQNENFYNLYYIELEKMILSIFSSFKITKKTLNNAIQYIKTQIKNKQNINYLYQIPKKEKNKLLRIIFPSDNSACLILPNFFNEDQKNHNQTIPQKLEQINEIQVIGRKTVYRLSMTEELDRLKNTPINSNAKKIIKTKTYQRFKEILKKLHLPIAPQSLNHTPLHNITNENWERAVYKLKEYNKERNLHTKPQGNKHVKTSQIQGAFIQL